MFYRSHLAERARKGERLLVIADNASSAAQVRPLLPPGPHGLIATSRKALPGIGRPRSLHQLQPDDAVTLLDLALREADPGDLRVREDREAAEKVVTACGCLPLALQIVAALLVQDPGQPLAERAARLTAGEGRLDSLDDGERDLRTVFDQTFESLTPQQQDLFRLLSLNAGPDISTAAAAALTHQTSTAIDHQLGRLAAAHMLNRGATRGRWQMHDLLRDYAEEQAAAHVADNRPARRKYDQARGRLVDYYVKWGEAGLTHVELSSGQLQPSPEFADRDAAMRWMDDEWGNLVGMAHATAPSTATARLSVVLIPYLQHRHLWDDALAVAALGLDSVRTMGDHRNEPGGWGNLGRVLFGLSRYEEALEASTTARDLSRRIGNVTGEATALHNVGSALRKLTRYEEALDALATALELNERIGDISRQAAVWNERGNVLNDTGRHEEALAAHRSGCALSEQVAYPYGMAINRNNMGTALRALGRYEEAVAEGRVAAETLEGEGDLTRAGEAYAELATTLAMSGAPTAQVRDTWLRSASCYEAAGAADKARESRAKAEGDADGADVEGADADRAKPDRPDADRADADRADAD
ncbi:tetratricopeptide repeat protein [Actinacidiphila sp. DG2A-62]|uniref:tetratricopeptide repeat protein n=1 Tax=Actinacidiphila sp. DG2A-62 TaxID=3108821 RepID=UPI002DBC6374|nr:tetratricopeptide repeat protein [Actinacidiphila sp. DG2A-62]MEC3996726.1 tetratricopeptide repeat protein [Actinacidiphila sp. DG2A-62]